MSDNTTFIPLPNPGGRRVQRYITARPADAYGSAKLTKKAPPDCAFTDGSILYIRYSAHMAAFMSAEAVAHAALSMALICPAMRADLIARLTAQDAAEGAAQGQPA